jgi:hypothetical protein
MSRQPVMAGFHSHGHHPSHHGHMDAHQNHYGVPAQNPYESMVHSGLAFTRLPMRAPVLAPAGYTLHHNQHTGQHQQHGRSSLTMAESAYLPEDEYARMQKLSNEWEPEATVSLIV